MTRRQPAAQTPAPRPSLIKAITDGILSRSRALRRKPAASNFDAPINPFEPAKHPPGVVKKADMAMDDAFGGALQWASQSISSVYDDSQHFLGFPELAILAQRPEYRRMSETIANEMTRKWIKITSTGDGDKSERIVKLEAAIDRLKVKDVFREVAEHDGYFGRGHIYLDTGSGDDPDELTKPIGDGRNAISKAKVGKGKLERLRTVEPVWCYPSGYNSSDPFSPDWYAPQMWFVQGRKIHASRFLTFVGREVPDFLKSAYSFGGLSLTQMAKPYVENWLRTRQSVADLIHSFSISGVRMDLQDALSVNQDALFKRAELYNNFRDNSGLMLLNKETEEFFNVSTPLGTLDTLQAQTQEHMSAVCGIPLVKLLGIQPAGLNASSDGELEAFYTWVHSLQEKMFTEKLTRILGFIQLSEFGDVDPDIGFTFEPLWSLTKKEEAEIRKIDAETGEVLIRTKAVTPGEERARVAADPDAPYTSMETDVAPTMNDAEKADVATKLTAVVSEAFQAAIIDQPTALRELKKIGAETGVFTSISDAMISEAEANPPAPTEAMAGGLAGDDGEFLESDHPRKQNGEFGAGGGSSASSGEVRESHAGVEGGITAGHKAALKTYTGAGYRQVNGHLIGGQVASPETEATVAHIDNLLSKASLPSATTVYRGAGSLQVKDILAQTGGKIAKGKTIDFKGFLSTSTDAGVARQFASQSSTGMQLEMRLPKGAQAVDIAKYSDSGAGEKETLIARNSRFKVVSFDSKAKKLVLEMIHMPVTKKQGSDAATEAPQKYEVADDDNRFFGNHTAGTIVGGPDDGEIVLTWEEFFGEPYPGDAR